VSICLVYYYYDFFFLKEVEYYYYYYYYRSLVCAAVGTSCYDVRVSWKGLGLVLDICVGGGS